MQKLIGFLIAVAFVTAASVDIVDARNWRECVEMSDYTDMSLQQCNDKYLK